MRAELAVGFDAEPDEAGERDEKIGEEENRQLEHLTGGADGGADAVGFDEKDAADDLPDDAGDIAGQFADRPDAHGGGQRQAVAELEENPPPGEDAKDEKEGGEHDSAQGKIPPVEFCQEGFG